MGLGGPRSLVTLPARRHPRYRVNAHFAALEPSLEDHSYGATVVLVANAAVSNPLILATAPPFFARHLRCVQRAPGHRWCPLCGVESEDETPAAMAWVLNESAEELRENACAKALRSAYACAIPDLKGN